MTSLQGMTTKESMIAIQEFVDYVDSFYGTNDPICAIDV